MDTVEDGEAQHPLLAALAVIDAALNDIATCSTLSVNRGEAEAAATAAHVAKNRLESVYLRALRLRDDRMTPAACGTAAWAADALHLSKGQAAADVRTAYTLDPEVSPGFHRYPHAGRLPQLGAALADGTVSRAHVDVATRTLKEIPHKVLQASGEVVDATLTEESQRFSPRDTATLAAHLLAVVAPDGMDLDDDRAYDRRDVTVGVRRDGMVGISGLLDPVGGAEAKTVLDRLAHPDRFRDEDGNLLNLTAGQRYADAFVEAFRHAAASLAAQYPAGEGPRIVVITNAEQLTHTPTEPPQDPGAVFPHAARDGAANRAAFWAGVHSRSTWTPHTEGARATSTAGPGAAGPEGAGVGATGTAGTGTGDATSPNGTEGTGPGAGAGTGTGAGAEAEAQVPAWCAGGRNAGSATCEATGPISPRTLHTLACDATMDRVVLDRHGAVQRMETLARPATRAMRRALAARDGGCAFPGCSAPPSWCDAHHVIYWSRGGRTVIENLCLLCRHHHTLMHREQWQIRMVDGVPWFIPPETLDPQRTPRRNTLHTEIDHVRRIAHHLATGAPLPERPPPPLWNSGPPEDDEDQAEEPGHADQDWRADDTG